jgi:formate hydrogenlyase subunit 3/multisubunit Na+/H+ antiporter MnhD subunit
MGSARSCAAAVLLFIGFGAKLGLIPLHAWMPDMYASSPTHTSALLSTVSSNVAVLVLFKGIFVYIGVTPDMYIISIILMVLASVTAIWGALESLIQTEPKRILAYSSMENMALVVMCFSLAMLFVRGGSGYISVVIVAGMFHAINHSVFKSLMFMTVGVIEDSTGETAIERMGGLAKVFPVFSVFALIAVMSMAAIPPFNGFASEWLMIRSMMGGGASGIDSIRLILPMGVAVLGISGMMAAVSYTRMYGFVFLGRPRSDNVAKPKPISFATYIPMAALAGACILLGLFSVPVAQGLGNGIASFSAFPPAGADRIFSSNMPLLAAVLAAAVVLMYVLCRIFRRNTSVSTTWNCGTPLEDNMQYSSVGFTQPLVRVFHPLYGDSLEIVDDEVTGHKKYSVRFSEPFVEYLYEPLGRAVMRISRVIGKMQNGSIQTYIGYILTVTVILLLAVSL